MRLERLKIRGIGPFANADLDLTGVEGKLVAITGGNGAGKCLPATAEVYTRGGPMLLGDAVEGAEPEEILGHTDGEIRFVRATAWHSCGARRVLRVTSRGWPMDVAATHPVMTSRGWVRAEELREGDHVAFARTLPINGDLDVTGAEVRLAGHAIADGSISNPEDAQLCAALPWKVEAYEAALADVFPDAQVAYAHRRVALRIPEPSASRNLRIAASVEGAGSNIKNYLRNNTTRFLEGFAGLALETFERIEADGVNLDDHRAYLLGNRAFGGWLQRHGLCHKSADKTLGDFARVPARQVPILLEALWFSDGYVSRDSREVSYTTASETLARQVRDLLLRIGVLSVRRTKRIKGRPYYTVVLVARTRPAFVRQVGLRLPKGGRLRSIAGSSNADSLPFDLWSRHLPDGPGASTWRANQSGMSREKFVALGGAEADTTPEIWWARVSDIEDLGEMPCFDVTVGTTEHAYVADGRVVHNSTLAELLPGAMYRETPTRGKLSSLATGRDSMVEATVVNGRRWTIRQSVDAVSGKGETLLLDDAGQPVLPDMKVRSFDHWAKSHLPAPEVLFASTFSAQGSGGLLEMKPGDRKRVLLRALGAERLEAMADVARENVRGAKGALSTLQARITDERARGGDVEALTESLRNKRGNLAICEAELARLVTVYDAFREQAEQVRVNGEARRSYVTRRLDLDNRAAKLGREISELETKIQNNRGLLEGADEIREDAARHAEVTAELRDLEERERACKAEIERLEALQASSYRAADEAKARRAAAEARAESARSQLEMRPAFDEINARLPELQTAAEATAATVELAGNIVKELAGLRLAGAEDRIWSLREALAMISDGDPEPVEIATAAMVADEAAIAAAAEAPAKLAKAETERAQAAERAGLAATELRRAETRLAAAPDFDQVEAELARAIAEASTASEEARVSWAHAEAPSEAVPALDETRKAIVIAKHALAHLNAAPNRLTLLDGAQARIEEREGQLQRLTAERAEVRIELESLEVVEEPPPAPDVDGAARAVEETRGELQSIHRDAAGLALALSNAEESAVRLETLEAERITAERDLADWNHLAADMGRDGLQALEIDSAGPELTELINDLLRTCVGSRWTVTVETTRLGSKGQQLEGCEIRVLDTERGREAAAETLSGGERVLVGEAVALALSMLACRKLGVERPTLVRDESGAALDPVNGRAYVAMLRRAVELVGADRCLFVSHSPELQALADARIVVADGAATVEQ